MIHQLALALTLILPLGEGEVSPPSPFEAARFRRHVAYLASDELQGRRVGTEGAAKAGNYIAEEFRKLGLSPLGDEETFFQTFPWKGQSGRNVIGVFRGTGDLARKAVIVSAHYDHLGTDPKRLEANEDGIYNGADDNASGVSALLLIAEALTAIPANPDAPRRSAVFIAFDAEERGLCGSRHYVQHPRWPLEDTSAVINLDMVGRSRDSRIFASDVPCSPLLESRLKALSEQCGAAAETRLSGLGSDHKTFIAREIPAFMLSTGSHADYHKVSDEVDKINAAGGARVAWLAYRMLQATIADPQPIPFTPLSPEHDLNSLLRIVKRAGIVPAPFAPANGQHPKILMVVPGSAAQKAGIRSGDVVTALDGHAFDRIEDVLVLWSRLDVTDGLRVSLERDGKPAEATLPAEVFEGLSDPN